MNLTGLTMTDIQPLGGVTRRRAGLPRVSRSSPTREQIRGGIKASHEDAQEVSPQVAVRLQQVRVQGCHSSARILTQACVHHTNIEQAGKTVWGGGRGGWVGVQSSGSWEHQAKQLLRVSAHEKASRSALQKVLLYTGHNSGLCPAFKFGLVEGAAYVSQTW